MRRFLLASAIALGAFPAAIAARSEAPCPREMQGDTIASIAFTGLRHTRESVVQRQLQHRVGQSFTCQTWEKEKNRLSDLDVFADIDLQIDRDSNGLALLYRFKELPPYVPYASLAKTDQDGFSAGPAVAALNLFGTGAHLELASRFGGTTEVYASLVGIEVGTWPLEYDVLLSHVDSWNHLQSFHENSWRFKVDAKKPLFSKWKGVFTGEIMTLSADRPGVTLTGGSDELPRLGAGLAWDGRDRRHLPRLGVYAEARVAQTGGWLGGAADNTEFLTDLRAYLPLGARNNLVASWLNRWRIGEVGSYDLYRAGGANSLRGFSHGSGVGKSESIAFLEDRFTLMPHRSFALWNWAIPLGIEAVAGCEVLAEGGLVEKALSKRTYLSTYLGIHLLTGGLDRIRLEGGSNISSWGPNFDTGFFDKADAQRFRTR